VWSPMKRWQNITAIAGFLIVLAFAAERFLQVRMLWTGLPWKDLHDFGRDLRDLGLFILVPAAMLLAVIVILWGVGKVIEPKPPIDIDRDGPAEREFSLATRLRHIVEIVALSVAMGFAAEGLSKMRTPGWWVAGMLNNLGKQHGFDLSLGLFFLLPLVIDGAICFAILWRGYLLYVRSLSESPAHGTYRRTS
jgi:hypothetical protein